MPSRKQGIHGRGSISKVEAMPPREHGRVALLTGPKAPKRAPCELQIFEVKASLALHLRHRDNRHVHISFTMYLDANVCIE